MRLRLVAALFLCYGVELSSGGQFTEKEWGRVLDPPEALKRAAAEAQRKRLLIVTTCSSQYISGAVNWIAHLHRLNIHNVLVLSMDNVPFPTPPSR